jgi:hypothetical protein
MIDHEVTHELHAGMLPEKKRAPERPLQMLL